ncbi:MAG: hypothetical protein ACFFD5_10705 [Candidatus Thorarchaeota archaeon]
MKKRLLDLNFEDEEGAELSIRVMRKEYIRKSIKLICGIVGIIALYISYLVINYIYKSSYQYRIRILFEKSYLSYFSLDLTLTWSLFSICIFLSIYLIRLLYLKFTPSVVKYIKKEFEYIGFQFQRRYDSGVIFLTLNIVSIALLIYLDLNYVNFDNSFTSFFVKNIVVIYLFLSLILPIIWGFVHDKFLIKLKRNFFITFDFQYNLLNQKGIDPKLIGIYLTSNRLCSRFNKSGKSVYKKISEIRWLPRRKKSYSISTFSPYLHFHEYSVPTNVQSQFLNIALALREWDNDYERKVISWRKYISLKEFDWKMKLKLQTQFCFYRFLYF